MPLGDSLRDARATISITLCLSTKRKHSICNQVNNNPNTAAKALSLTFPLPVSRPPARLRVRSPAASSSSFTAASAAAAEESGGVVVDAKLVTCNMVGIRVELKMSKTTFLVIDRTMHVGASCIGLIWCTGRFFKKCFELITDASISTIASHTIVHRCTSIQSILLILLIFIYSKHYLKHLKLLTCNT